MSRGKEVKSVSYKGCVCTRMTVQVERRGMIGINDLDLNIDQKSQN